MPVHVVADTVSKLSDLRATLERKYTVTSELLGGSCNDVEDIDAVVVTADLRVVDNIAALKETFAKLTHARKRIFLIDQKARVYTAQAYALGATHVLANPVTRSEIVGGTRRPGSPRDRRERRLAWFRGGGGGRCDRYRLDVLRRAGRQAHRCRGAQSAGSRIADSIAEDGLTSWLETVRRHHEGTYQHCLLVTGIAADFGLSLGLAKPDIERLYSAAMFHDIGKAKIPLAVLDKPGRLDAQERALIETHPVAGYEVLKGNAGISPEILDAVRHHHEYLDGSGYPDALCDASISDIVRILTISDIFAALIEHRTYKPTMPREQAYEIIQSMHGKLERPLVAAFKDVALNC